MGIKKKTDIQKIVLAIIFIWALFLRFYKLEAVPPSLNWDEAALGYNAYSLLKTGRDEYGIQFPAVLRSFGDYKPPIYTYLTIPSVAFFGLNELAVRFPSALFGTLTVLVFYFLIKELFLSSPPRRSAFAHLRGDLLNLEPRTSNLEPAIASLLLAISPWHIQFSRGAFEANLGLFLAVFGTYFFVKGLKYDESESCHPEFISGSQIPKRVRNDNKQVTSLQKRFLLPVSALSFALCLYAYHSSRIFVPLLVFSLALIYRRQLLKIKKWAFVAALIGLIIAIPFIKSLSSGQILARFSGVSAFADPGILNRSISKIEQEQSSLLGRVLHNRRIVYAKIFLQNYLSHFAPNFLLIEGDQNPRHHAPANGLLYFWGLITIPVGLFVLSRTKGKGKLVVLAFLLIGPIAAAPATGAPHAIRSLNSLPGWVIISGFGLTFLFQKTKKTRLLLTMIILADFIYWSNLYFIHLPLETSQAWQYGYKAVVKEVSAIEKNYDCVVVTGKYDQPYIFFLFFKQYDPQKYQEEYGNPKELPRYERAFSKYQFLEAIDLAKIKKEEKILIIGADEEVGQREDFKTLKRIDFLDGSPAFFIGEKI